MTREQLDAIAERLAYAVEGPWKRTLNGVVLSVTHEPYRHIADCLMQVDGLYARGNAEFIAHSRQDVEDLLAYIAELETRLGIRPVEETPDAKTA